jgi:hypothetical protein
VRLSTFIVSYFVRVGFCGMLSVRGQQGLGGEEEPLGVRVSASRLEMGDSG